MPRVTHDGVELSYEIHGDGAPLVLVHGFTGDATDWRHQVAAFSSGYRVLVVDLRGHGKSSAPEDPAAYTVDRMSHDVEAVVADAGIGRYHLVGHSMGGGIAQEIALRSPERLLSLTLEDTADVFEVRDGMDMMRQFAAQNGMAAIAEFTSRVPLPNMSDERRSEVAARMAAMSLDAFLGAAAALTAWQGTATRLGSIGSPTLVVCGELDAALLEASKRLAAGVPGASYAVIAGAGHSPQEERPDEFNAVLARFLKNAS